MVRYVPRSARRVVLAFDALEDRYAPASLAVLGSAIDFVPATPPAFAFDVAPAARVADTVAASPTARLDDVSIGFMHPFAQNGFISSGDAFEAPAPPRPAPVQPPALPVIVLPQPTQDVQQVDVAPAVVQPAALSVPQRLPATLDSAPLEIRSATPRVEPAPPTPTTESPTTFDAGETTQTASRPVIAAMGMMAVGFISVRAPSRRDDDRSRRL